MTEKYTPKVGDRVKISFEADVTHTWDDGGLQVRDSDLEYYEFQGNHSLDGFELEKIEKPLEEGWYLFSSPCMNDRVYWYDGTKFSGTVYDSEDTITKLEPAK